MDLARLRIFLTAADCGSLSGTAARLRLPLSTVSRQVAELEKEVGARLFERTGRGVRPTPAGERLVARARDGVVALELGLAEARDAAEAETDAFRISASPDVAGTLVAPALVQLARTFPDVAIDVAAEIRRVALLEERYDAAVRSGPVEPSELLATLVGTISVCLCAPPGWDEAHLPGADWVRVHRIPPRIRGRRGNDELEISLAGHLTLPTFSQAAEVAVALGRPVSLPSYVAAPYLSDGRLIRLYSEWQLPRVDIRVVRIPGRRGSAVLGALVEQLRVGIARFEAAVGDGAE